jgi:hypothetical protein
MKISETIEWLQGLLEDYGDIEVDCITPGCSASFEYASSMDQTVAESSRVIDDELMIGIDG